MKSAIILSEDSCKRVLATVDSGLCSGLGSPKPGGMCVEAAVCYAFNLPHGDDPTCVAAAVRSLVIKLNDVVWSSNQARAEGLRRLALAQLGSLGVVDDKEFAKRVAEMTIRKFVPIALRAAAERNPKHADKLKAAADQCEKEGSRESALAARKIAYAAADAAADADAYAAAAAYADAAAYAAARDKRRARRDEVLKQCAEEVVQILSDMKSPGTQWLHLTNK